MTKSYQQHLEDRAAQRNQHTPLWRNPHDAADCERHGLQAATRNDEPSLTQQHFTEDSDVNVIARRFGLDKGPLPNLPIDPRFYGDFSQVPTLREALDIIRDAEDKFRDLDPRLRARFRNNPWEMHDFLMDATNFDEAIRLGLIVPPQPPPQPGVPEKETPQAKA